jgi:hypothetical protein
MSIQLIAAYRPSRAGRFEQESSSVMEWIIALIALLASLVFIFWWIDYCDQIGIARSSQLAPEKKHNDHSGREYRAA